MKLRNRGIVILSLIMVLTMSIVSIGCELEPNTEVFNSEGIEVPVLMYHHIDEIVEKGNSLVVTPQKFKQDMELIKSEGYNTIGFEELYNYLNEGVSLPKKPIIITFDDGYTSNYDYAFPIAKELDMKYVISVVGWSMGRDSFIDSEKSIIPHFSAEEMLEMVDSGHIEIQNHTYDLHNPEGISLGYGSKVGQGVKQYEGETITNYKKRLERDLNALENILNEVGIKSTVVTYPFGAYTNETELVIKDMGFKGSVTTREGIRFFKTIEDMFEIPRINITEDMSSNNILEKLNK